ncbi:hypothetical protein MJO10_27965, partial [Salmonella enterica subsp. enterica serovar Anatum]|nr:hypothetical protein [Salmonella enterica subsp. enterica serovar Anatum]
SASEQRMALRQEQEQLQSRIQHLMQRAPVWLAAQNSLNQLSEPRNPKARSPSPPVKNWTTWSLLWGLIWPGKLTPIAAMS